MFDRPYNRKLEIEADEVGLQLAAKVTCLPQDFELLVCQCLLNSTRFHIWPVTDDMNNSFWYFRENGTQSDLNFYMRVFCLMEAEKCFVRILWLTFLIEQE